MSGLSPAGETIVITAIVTGRFLSLHTIDPGDAGAGEVAGDTYVRQSYVFAISGANPTIASNSAIIQFPTALALWGLITHWGLWDTASGGTFLGGYPVIVPKTIDAGDTARWDVGTLKIGTDELIP